MRMLIKWVEQFGHIVISWRSAMLVVLENRWNIQNSGKCRILTFRGRVSDLSALKGLDVVNIVSVAVKSGAISFLFIKSSRCCWVVYSGISG